MFTLTSAHGFDLIMNTDPYSKQFKEKGISILFL